MDQLGAGGQGRTFRAIDRQTNTEVAIKVIRLRELEGWKGFDLFERECEVLAALTHPGIPKFLDRYAVEETGEFFLVMELVDGAPLSSWLTEERSTPITGEHLLELLWKSLDILGYLHGRAPPVVHRDIKPHNLMERRDGSVALIDFGGVRALLDEGGSSTVVGTFGYMAPEQLHGQATPATDIYALAATIAAIGCGTPADQLPRDGLRIDLGETRLKRSPLRPVLDRMLAPVPSRRLQNAAAVREALMTAIHGDKPAAGPREAPSSPRAPATRPDEPVLEHTGVSTRVPVVARQLARVPPPLNIIVWLATALAAGLFILLEVALLPALYALIARFTQGLSAQKRLDHDRAASIASIRTTRHTLQYIAQRTNPTRSGGERDNPRALGQKKKRTRR
jgi:serine/threonine protein kinase